jgi:hypothetical protein
VGRVSPTHTKIMPFLPQLRKSIAPLVELNPHNIKHFEPQSQDIDQADSHLSRTEIQKKRLNLRRDICIDAVSLFGT